MANTYSQLYVHIVFAVESRAAVLPPEHKDELHKFITGIVKNRGQKLIAINSMSDHVHILVGQKPDISLSDLVRDIKAGSSKFINESRWVGGRFSWQEGFGAFSYSHSQLQNVVRYIQNQEQHHRKKTFREEYVEMLEKFKVDYDGRYIFQSVEQGAPDGAYMLLDTSAINRTPLTGLNESLFRLIVAVNRAPVTALRELSPLATNLVRDALFIRPNEKAAKPRRGGLSNRIGFIIL